MKIFEQQDDQGLPRRSKTAKKLRRMKHKRERAKAKQDPECVPTYKKFRGYTL